MAQRPEGDGGGGGGGGGDDGGGGVGHGRVLSARLDNVRLLADALSCIYSSARRAQDVVLSVPAAGGLKFTVEQTGCLLASVLLPLMSSRPSPAPTTPPPTSA
jgi:hypothetical protein